MSWLAEIAAIFEVIKQLLSIGQQLWAFIQKEEDAAARKNLAQNLKNATQIASQTGDTSALENIFKSGNSAPNVPTPAQ